MELRSRNASNMLIPSVERDAPVDIVWKCTQRESDCPPYQLSDNYAVEMSRCDATTPASRTHNEDSLDMALDSGIDLALPNGGRMSLTPWLWTKL